MLYIQEVSSQVLCIHAHIHSRLPMNFLKCVQCHLFCVGQGRYAIAFLRGSASVVDTVRGPVSLLSNSLRQVVLVSHNSKSAGLVRLGI